MRSAGYAALVLVSASLLSGCKMLSPEPAVIFDLRHDKAVIQASAGTLFDGDGTATTEVDIIATAREACGIHGRHPKPVSERRVGDYRRLLFACVE